MGYVGVRGGHDAIDGSRRLLRYEQLRGDSPPLGVEQIRDQLYLAVDRVMGEGGIYAPDHAALAIKQASGDLLEASFLVRAYSATLPRLAYSVPQDSAKMRIIRRISAAFKDIPGGQILGATSDYSLRMLNFELYDEDGESRKRQANEILERALNTESLPETFPKVVELLRKENLLADRVRRFEDRGAVFDATREALRFPATRSAALQVMARGETGGMLAIAYSAMRSFGIVHPTVGELRVGYLPIEVQVANGRKQFVGEIKITEAEIVMCFFDEQDSSPKFQLGYGACFGQNETKAIAMALLDHTTQAEQPRAPSEDQEFVLTTIDGVEAMGYGNHWKMPHYVTFQSELDRLRKTRERHDAQ